MNLGKEEYNNLNAEKRLRIEQCYNANYTYVSIIIAAWAFIISSYISCFGNLVGINEFVRYILLYVLGFIFLASSFISIILWHQWNENLMDISKICSYLKVYYELPSLVNNEEKVMWDSYTGITLFDASKKSILLIKNASIHSIWL